MNLVLWASLLLGAEADAADVIVVCPAPLRAALEPWLGYRRGQGLRLAVVDSGPTPDQVRRQIRAAARLGGSRFLVLIGDAGPAGGELVVPTHYAAARVNVRFGSEPTIATDNWYADLDDDGLPDLATGRLTADSPDDLGRMVRKILAWEQGADEDGWRRRINFVAGESGFGALADAALEGTTRALLATHIPAAFVTTMTYASWTSPYCPAPAAFRETALARLSEGCMFWVYVGHGLPRRVDAVRTPAGAYPILSAQDAAGMTCTGPAPIALLLACYTGAFDAAEDCLAEEMLRAAGGPVAVVCGSRVTMPYAMCVLGRELLVECFEREGADAEPGAGRESLGELLRRAKRSTMLRPRTDPPSRLIDGLATLLNPASDDLAAERAEHILLFNLLGDPLLRLHRPLAARVEAPPRAAAGGVLAVAGASPIDGEAEVELVVRRDRLAFQPPPRPTFDAGPAAQVQFQQVYQRANDTRLAATRVRVERGAFEARLPTPDHALGPCHVRVLVRGRGTTAIGAADVQMVPPELPAAAGK